MKALLLILSLLCTQRVFAACDSRYDFPLTWKPTDPIAAIHLTNREQFIEWFKTMMTE